jgi:predicted DNA-binding transcriptional regulator YafY
MPAPKTDVMLRNWELLQLIPPRAPGKTARQLLDDLERNGYKVHKKTVERDLVDLSTIFPITANEVAKPYQWYWTPNISLALPGVTVTEAMSLVLAESVLLGLMHKSLLKPLQARLDAAKRLLTEAKGSNSKSGWVEKIRSVPRDLVLHAPSVRSQVIEHVHDALLEDRQIEIDYRSLKDAAASWRTVNPRALLLKGSVMYLLADKLSTETVASDDTVKQYALHRIRATRPTIKPVVPRAFNLTRYIKSEEHEVGHRRATRIRLKVSEDLAKILRETPLAAKQRIKTVGTAVVVEAAVRNTPALRKWILGHGPAVEVLGPAALRTAIKTKIEAAAAAY